MPASPIKARQVNDANQISDLKTMFDLVDSNRDGVIDKQQVKMLLSILRIQCSEEELEQFFKTLDSDKDGSVQFHEYFLDTYFVFLFSGKHRFCTAMSKKADGFDRDELLKAFSVLSDGKKPGHIAIQDLYASLTVIGKVAEHEARAITQQLDADRNNLFNYEEYVELLTYLQK